MNRLEENQYQAAITMPTRKAGLIGKSAVIGASVGLIASVYRFVLMKAETFSFAVYDYIRSNPVLIPLLFLVLCALGYGVGYLASKYKYIGGSGIPQVKGIIMGHFEVPWLSTLIAKFVGGAASILAGLSLGREGPSIQIGSCVAEGIGNRLASSRTEKRMLIAGGASAGLAAAFNAPLAGAMFAVEEIFKYISPVILLVTMVCAVLGDFVSKMVFGVNTVFSFHTPVGIPLKSYWLLLLLGVLLGCMGALYNYVLLKTQALYKSMKRLPPPVRVMIPFVLAGCLGLVFPTVLGGGHAVVEKLEEPTGLSMLLLIFAVKFLFSMASFSSGAPGGIFFPLLIMGAALGSISGEFSALYLNVDRSLLNDLIVVSMAGYFSAIVRAPFTGVILLLEMTGSFVNLLPLVIVSLVAYVVADLLKSRPIYDSLLANQLAERGCGAKCSRRRKITVETIVQHGSQAADQTVKSLTFPKHSLLIAIRRDDEEFIPSGNTLIRPGDYLVFLLNEEDEAEGRSMLEEITTVH